MVIHILLLILEKNVFSFLLLSMMLAIGLLYVAFIMLRYVLSVTRVYVPRFFVSSQQRFGATDIKALGASQLSGLGQTML